MNMSFTMQLPIWFVQWMTMKGPLKPSHYVYSIRFFACFYYFSIEQAAAIILTCILYSWPNISLSIYKQLPLDWTWIELQNVTGLFPKPFMNKMNHSLPFCLFCTFLFTKKLWAVYRLLSLKVMCCATQWCVVPFKNSIRIWDISYHLLQSPFSSANCCNRQSRGNCIMPSVILIPSAFQDTSWRNIWNWSLCH